MQVYHQYAVNRAPLYLRGLKQDPVPSRVQESMQLSLLLVNMPNVNYAINDILDCVQIKGFPSSIFWTPSQTK